VREVEQLAADVSERSFRQMPTVLLFRDQAAVVVTAGWRPLTPAVPPSRTRCCSRRSREIRGGVMRTAVSERSGGVRGGGPNAVVLGMLRSPVRVLVQGRLCALRFTGRRTGVVVTMPVEYTRGR
jgi:hypothetical protein